MAMGKSKLSKTFIWILMGLLFIGLAGFGATNLSGNARSVATVGEKDVSTDAYVRAFAEQVHVPYADYNAMHLPDGVSARDMAALGCRFMTAFHALTARGEVGAGDWVAVHGCGGVGLSTVHIADALGARVVAVEPQPLLMRTLQRRYGRHRVHHFERPCQRYVRRVHCPRGAALREPPREDQRDHEGEADADALRYGEAACS